MVLRLAFYKAKYGTWHDKLISILTCGPYSHVEIIFTDGMWYSSSPRDGGVRYKEIKPMLDHWDFINIKYDSKLYQMLENKIREWCNSQLGRKYDWTGALMYRWLNTNRKTDKWFCSNLCTTALQQSNILTDIKPNNESPNSLYRRLYA